MSSRRILKAASAIREVVSSAILLDVQDPRVRDVTVIGVQVTPDMRQAKVLVSIMGDEKKQALAMHGLQNSAGFLQQQIGEKIDTRYIPKLSFVLDQGVKKSIEVSRMLSELLPKDEASAAGGDLEEADIEDADVEDEDSLDNEE
ncbi:MAG TPA: 30S ribosome-binding factor RbfA [Pirellulaceae bacterium]|nr:30S ribosome-binding factor RbfA [Pirellulaceae bacterium]